MLQSFFEKTKESINYLLTGINIRKLFLIILTSFMGIMIFVFALSTYETIYKTVYQERIAQIKYVIQFGNDILKYENYLAKTKQKTLKKAQQTSLEIFKGVRFENNDYMWVTRTNGKMLYHPYPELIGTDVRTYTDIKGYNFGTQLVEIPLKKGGGYVEYYWTKIKEEKDKHYPKVSYVSEFKPWGWVIGTGIYVDDIKSKVLTSMFLGILPVIVAFLLMSLIFKNIIFAAIIAPIEDLSDKSLKLAESDLDIIFPKVKSDTEIGKLYNSFKKFVEFFEQSRNNEKKLSLIMDNITDVLITADTNGKIKTANPAIKNMFEYTPEEVIGLDIDLLTSPQLFSGKADDLSGITYFNEKYELNGIKKSGEKFNIEVDVNEIVYDKEDFFILLIRDISIRKRFDIENLINEPQSETEESIETFSQNLLYDMAEKIKKAIDIINDNNIKLLNLVADILNRKK